MLSHIENVTSRENRIVSQNSNINANIIKGGLTECQKSKQKKKFLCPRNAENLVLKDLEMEQNIHMGRQAFPHSKTPRLQVTRQIDSERENENVQSPLTHKRRGSILSLFRRGSWNSNGSRREGRTSLIFNEENDDSYNQRQPVTQTYISEEWSNLLYQTPPKKVVVFRD